AVSRRRAIPAMTDDRLFAEALTGGMLGASDASIVVAEWTDRGGGHEPPMYISPLHVHLEDDEAWYVLEGRLCVRLGDQDYVAGPGGAVLAPRGAPHTYWNPHPDPARYLLVMTPRISQLIEAIHAMSERSEKAM